jgi:hypothetical protein
MKAVLSLALLGVFALLLVWLALRRRSKRNLLSLPTEIPQEIAKNPPLESIMALSLASKELRVILTQQASGLAHDRFAKFIFLQLLQRDMQSQLLCRICNKLYPYRRKGGLQVARCPHMSVTYGYRGHGDDCGVSFAPNH